ncbi:MAG: XRE family transcriptional regulator [Paludibacter sp.]|nr:XRE family transcriptional regulator [Paludibacter sp.]
MTTEKIAQELKVTPYELHLFLHRKRLFKINERKNLCLKLIRFKFIHEEYFTPTFRFFDATGIRSRRWWQIFRGEKLMTEREYLAVVKHLQIPLTKAQEVRQLDLFDNELL